MEDIVQAIVEAEREAAAQKARAQTRAAEIVADADRRAADIVRASEEACKQLREEIVARAEEQAEAEYDAAIRVSRAEAEQYANEALEFSEVHVCNIVGRLTK